jgi:CheY-like chemotaxis protein
VASCVLIVEDNPTNLKLASEVLENAGFRVIRAVDSEQAQLALRQERPDLILMDIALPGMDGLALTRLLRADPAFGTIPIVALTAFAMKGDDQKALEAGCSGYITKPIQVRELAGQVRSFLLSTVQPRKAP